MDKAPISTKARHPGNQAELDESRTAWNIATRCWNVLLCDIRVELLDGGTPSPFPLLLLNDDCDDDALVEERLAARQPFWKDGSVKPDLEKTAPTAYADDDLKTVKVQVPDVFGDDNAADRDDRAKITWKNRFEELKGRTRIYNFFDHEDEVLGLKGEDREPGDGTGSETDVAENELEDAPDEQVGAGETEGGGQGKSWTPPEFEEGDDELGLTEGASGIWFVSDEFWITVRKLAWQKQEYNKGRTGKITSFSCTTEAGWGFQDYAGTDGGTGWMQLGCRHDREKGGSIGTREYRLSPKGAGERPREYFSHFSQAVFKHTPALMNSSALTQAQIDHLLVYAVPALSGTAGHNELSEGKKNHDVAVACKTNGWPRDDKFCLKGIWTHSYFMLVPYFYTYELYNQIIGIVNSSTRHQDSTPGASK